MKLKNLVLGLVLILAIFGTSMASADCSMPAQTNLWIYNVPNDIWFPAHTQRNQRVVIVEEEKQVDKEYLKRFDIHPGMDWSDGVIVFDKKSNLFILVHRKDITCDGDI